MVKVKPHVKCSQRHLSASPGRTTPRIPATILSIIAASLVVTSRAFAQIEPEGWLVAQSMLSNVVRIEVQKQGHVESGFGLIAGEKAGILYIVTAYHVVSGAQAKNQELTPVKVKLFGPSDGIHARGGTIYDAEVMESHDRKHDLAVVTLAAPSGTGWNTRCMGRYHEQKRPTELYFIGQSKGPEHAIWYTAPTPGHVVSEEPVDNQFDIDGLWAASGSAGGPVVGKTGIVGMIQKSTPDHTRALSIDFIKTMFLKWGYPWSLDYR